MEVKVAAIKAAKSKSEALTVAVGQNTGRAIFIQETETSSSGVPGAISNIRIRGISTSSLYGSRAPEPDIDFEKIRLQYAVLCRFELK